MYNYLHLHDNDYVLNITKPALEILTANGISTNDIYDGIEFDDAYYQVSIPLPTEIKTVVIDFTSFVYDIVIMTNDESKRFWKIMNEYNDPYFDDIMRIDKKCKTEKYDYDIITII